MDIRKLVKRIRFNAIEPDPDVKAAQSKRVKELVKSFEEFVKNYKPGGYAVPSDVGDIVRAVAAQKSIDDQIAETKRAAVVSQDTPYSGTDPVDWSKPPLGDADFFFSAEEIARWEKEREEALQREALAKSFGVPPPVLDSQKSIVQQLLEVSANSEPNPWAKARDSRISPTWGYTLPINIWNIPAVWGVPSDEKE